MTGLRLKSTAKLLISFAFFVVCKSAKHAMRLVGRQKDERLVILYYHGVSARDKAGFIRQMEALQRSNIRVVPADYTGPLAGGSTHVAITFDDAFDNLRQNALPVLHLHSFPATIFAPVGALGERPTWPMDEARDDDRDDVMTAEQLRCCASELITIGSHGITHQHMASLTEDEAWFEIKRSRELLTEILGKDISLFAFPHGSFNGALVDLCRDAGYEHVFTIVSESVRTIEGKSVRGRVKVDPNDGRLEFYLKCNGAYAWQSYFRVGNQCR